MPTTNTARGYVFTFGIEDAPPDQMTFVASSPEEAQKAAEAYRAEKGWLSAELWETVPAPKVILVYGSHYLPIGSAVRSEREASQQN